MKKNLSIREKIGQRLFIGFEGQTITETLKELICEYRIGNIILFRQNVENKYQLKKLCDDIQQLVQQELGILALISIDQEGGMVTRLSPDCSNVPGAMAISATGNKQYAYQAGLLTAKELVAMGVNFNLAPNMDINNNHQNPVIGIRSYGDTAKQVSEYGLEMIKGLTDGGVISCVKHFPGHGNTITDSHLGLPTIDFDYEQIETCELVPFKSAIDAGVPSVMMAHISYPKIEKENIPATFSKVFIQEILRKRLGFKGLIISDCMEMQAIRTNYGTPNGILRSIKAGIDIAFCSHTAELAKQTVLLIEQAVENGEITEDMLDENLNRIIDIKQRYLEKNHDTSLDTVGCEQHTGLVSEILEKSICLYQDEKFELGNKPFFVACEPYNATGITNVSKDYVSFSKELSETFSGEYIINSSNPDETEIAEILSKVSNASSVVFGSYQAHLNSGQIALADRLSSIGVPMLCVALRNPYDVLHMPRPAKKIVVFEYTKKSIKAIEKVINGQLIPSGILPINI